MKKLFEKIKQNFEFFEKKQGRPSKETLRKRRAFYITLVLLFILVLVGITSLTLSKINKNKLKGEVATTTNNFNFSEDYYDNKTGDYNYYVVAPNNIKYYKICFYTKNKDGKYGQPSCNEIFSDTNEHFSLSPFSKEDVKEQHKISIQVFDDGNYTIVNKNVNTWKPDGWKINSIDNSAYAEFTVDPSLKHETCINDEVEGGNVVTTFVSNLNLIKRIINQIFKLLFNYTPFVENTNSKQLGIVKKAPDIEETSGVSNVTAEKTYNTTFELKNTYNSKAYYKIVKYKSTDLKPENLTDKGTCLAFNGSVSVKTNFNISKTNKEAAGVLKVFLSKELCEAEDGDYTKAFLESITKYKYTGSTATAKPTTKTTASNKVVPKMVLNKIQLYEKNISLGTVNKKIGDKTYPVHEIKNEGQVNVTYNTTKNVANESTYYRKMYIYDDFEEGKGKQINSDSSYCRPYNDFKGVASDDFKIGVSQSTIRTEFKVYKDSNCTSNVVSTTTDYYLYNGGEVKDNDTDGTVTLTAYVHQETACVSDMNKLTNAIYKDSTYGDVRVIAANKLKNDYGCGTIVELKGKIQLENQTVSSVRAIVLDIGGTTALKNGTVFDLMLNCSETGTGSLMCSGNEMYYSNPTVTYKVLRKGYKGTPSGVSTTKKTASSNNITITLKDKSGLKSNKNIVNVTNTGDYHVEATVTQTGNSRLYYRWDTYTGVNANNHSYTDDQSHGNYTYCSSFTDKSKTFTSLETLEFTKEDTPRSGKFSLYSSESDCKDGKNAVKSAVIGYQIGSPSTTITTNNNNSKISISFKDTDGSEKDSSGAYMVLSSGSYTPIVTIKNPNAQKIYYRWFTYKGLDASTFNWASSCENTSEKEHTKKDLENLWVDTSGEYSKRSGKLKVYSDYNSCNNDGTGTNNSNVLASSIVNYKYNDPSTNTTGFKFLRNYTNGNATLANITKKIGSQTPSDCYDYALAYGVYIIKNGSGSFDNLKCNSYYHPAGDYGGSAYGANGSGQYTNSVNGYRNMYDKIKSTIDSSLPIVIRIDNSRAGGSGTHFITIIGYKDTVKSASINSWSDFKSALWVLDPAYLEGGQVMSKPLSSFAYNFYSDEPSQLFWWNKASDAKMPKWCGN